MRTEFTGELKAVQEQLLHMGAIIEESMRMTIDALKKTDVTLAEAIVNRDDMVDEMEMEMESKCLELIYKQQPVASDLRTLASALKIITDLERIADNCADISEYIVKIAGLGRTINCPGIVAMAQQVKRMLKNTIDAYVEMDARKAIDTSEEDDVVDDYFVKNVAEIQRDMQASPDNVEAGTYCLFIVKYLERMGDHATNICEWIAYRVTGGRQQTN